MGIFRGPVVSHWHACSGTGPHRPIDTASSAGRGFGEIETATYAVESVEDGYSNAWYKCYELELETGKKQRNNTVTWGACVPHRARGQSPARFDTRL